MKLTKKLEAEIKQVYLDFWDSLLSVNMKSFNSYLAENFKQIGTTEAEVFFNKKAAAKFLKATEEQVVGNIELRKRKIKIETVDELVLITDQSDAYVKIGKVWTFYAKTRSSSWLQKKDNKWKFIQQHISFPDNRTEEGETIALEKIAKENLELRDAVKRRTIELEDKNRELEIEAALEKVRAVAMGMYKPGDLSALSKSIFTELRSLGYDHIRNAEIVINHYEKKTVTTYHYSGYGSSEVIEIDYTTNPIVHKWVKDLKKADDVFVPVSIPEKQMKDWNKYRKELGYKNDPGMRRAKTVYYYSYSIGLGALSVSTWQPITGDQIKILERFRNVFNLSYQRYIDIAKAEAQAREAKIETALERVRARTMAMQKSEELTETSLVLFQQFKDLGEISEQISIGIFNKDENILELYSTLYGSQWKEAAKVDLDEPVVVKKLYTAWKAQKRSMVIDITGKDLRKYNAYRKKLSGLDYKEKRWVIHAAFFSKGVLTFSITEPHPETIQLLERFAGVFEQTYTRFLDLQKAEAQAREAKIEASLERVRARTMAMHKSSDLLDVVKILGEQFELLGFKFQSVNFDTDFQGKDWNLWLYNVGSAMYPGKIYIPYIDHPCFNRPLEAFKKGGDLHSFIFTKEEKDSLFDHIYTNSVAKYGSDERKRFTYAAPGFAMSVAVTKITRITIANYNAEPFSEEENAILRRFANVFEQSYTRFLDLQKAEAQARESQIETALERVRAVAMAMRKPEELMQISEVIYKQLFVLGFNDVRNVQIAIDDDAKQTYNGVEYSEYYQNRFKQVPYDSSPLFSEIAKEIKKSNTAFYQKEIIGKEFEDWLQWRTNIQDREDSNIHPGLASAKSMCFYLHSVGTGMLGISTFTPIRNEHLEILKRFKNVFELSYRRYIDIEKAEAQAREAQIETALEKVRSRSLAMHNSEELQEVVNTVFERLQELNIEMDSCNIAIFKEGTRDYDYWIASHFQKRAASFHMPYTELSLTRDLVAARESGKIFSTTAYSFEEKNEWFDYAFKNTDFKFLSEERKQYIFNAPAIMVAIAFSKHTGVQVNRYSGKLLTEGEAEILKRFSKVFEQAYIRFLDLEKAEAQAREAQIETALEKVRSRSLAMHQSEELQDVIMVVSEQLQSLGFRFHNASFVRYNEKNGLNFWLASPGQPQPYLIQVPYLDNPVFDRPLEAIEKGIDFIADIISPKENHEWLTHLLEKSILKNVTEEDKKLLLNTAGYARSLVITKNIILVIGNYASVPYTTEQNSILKRFGNVFEQAYTRFLDLQKAEAQAREAQIEASLERVRSKTMAMHNSQDVGETVATMFDELVKLGVETVRCGIAIIDEAKTMEVWTASSKEDGSVKLIIGQLDMRNHPLFMQVYDAWKNKELVTKYELIGEDLKDYFRNINNSPNYSIRYDIGSLPYKQSNTAFMFPEGSLFVFSQEPLASETIQIFKRFAGVFGQTYRRYLDLQKAESQAREAQIEVALERVRSKAMAMHKTEDLNPAVSVVFEELEKLDPGVFRCGISILDKEKRTGDIWVTSLTGEGSAVQVSGGESFDIHPLLQGAFNAWLNREDFSYLLKGDDLDEYYKAVKDAKFELPESQTEYKEQHCFTTTYGAGGLFAFRETQFTDEAKKVMKRFANVFDLTYKRFLDLQNAEASAKEARIEAALEKVRGKAMAMHNSNDVSVTASLVFTELRKLGIRPIRCGVGLLNKNSRRGQLYAATSSAEGDSLSLVGWVELSGHPVLSSIYDTWLRNEEYYPELSGEQLKSYYELLLSGFSVPDSDWQGGYKQYGTFLPFSIGCLYAWSDVKYNEDEIKILKRFASIIDLTFRRYIELQKSEANTKEAIKQAALDRIRADIASMRTINDLDRITPLIWNELTVLGIPFIRCGVFIMDEEHQLIHTFLSTPDGKAIAAFHLPYDTPGNLRLVVSNWKTKSRYVDHWHETEFAHFADILVKEGALVSAEQYLKTIPHGGFYLHFFPFLQGMLYVGNTEKLNEEQIELIQHVADAFSTAYARYEDFNRLEAAKQQVENALTNLKQAQQQLVQSEKMASLGELTAGIAHEIQNPLNFVNNFSDVSSELLDEMMEELTKGNVQLAKEIVEDVKQNLEKINHHGKRADGIVKGMLQHSRTSSGQKELTDINALADEYLRLAFHGLRAKDKSFNAKFETDFDSSIGKINVMPQDIGRVILNLINNAFYAVSEKKKQDSNGYEPTVTVTTKKKNDKTLIVVKDNGNGIPQKVLDKIFQPFFTTKPTGQGTGLGLSLAYDIVTKSHGGELKVETKEGDGSEFIIIL